MKLSVLVALLIALNRPAWPAAQSLGELARLEAERRKQVTPGKQFTDKDLRPEPKPSAAESRPVPSQVAPPSVETTRSASGDAPGASSTTPQNSARASEPRNEAYWRGRTRELRGHIERVRDEMTAVEGRLTELEGQAGASVGREREVLTAVLEKLRKDSHAFTEEFERLEQRARVAKVPADWLK